MPTEGGHDRVKVVALMGPTAAGKTALAVDLVDQLPLEIISVDSAMVYRGMDIGTAKPDRATLAKAPHRLIDIRDPWTPYSAAEFREDATREIHAIRKAGHTPLLAGGTMLYFRALFEGLSELPEADPAVRAEIEARAEAHGWESLHRELARVDPQAADRIHPNDPQRIQRALEVYRLSGKPISELQGQTGPNPYHVLRVVVCPAPRARLHARIEKRRDQMFEEGLIEEVKSLRGDPRFDPELPSMRSVGYRQVLEYLDGRHDLDETRRRVLFATRQLAKRQLTWLRRESDALWINPEEPGWRKFASGQIRRFLGL